MSKMMLIIACAVLCPLVSMAGNCPLGRNESVLTVQRVMINFGRFYGGFDDVAYKARHPENEVITDQDLTNAFNNLQVAVACADEVLANPTADVLPSRLSSIKDESQRQQLIEAYLYFMEDFKDGLMECGAELQNLLQTELAARNYSVVIEKAQEMNEKINKAHSKM